MMPRRACAFVERGMLLGRTDLLWRKDRPRDCYANGQMVNFMDIEASYWPARFKLAPGEKLVLTGYFPPARYPSVNSYGGSAPTSSQVDADIEPDAGSTIPFRQGARRDSR